MEVLRRKVAFEDERGTITDILEDEEIDHVTIITSKKGALRGNHYHKKTVQFAYLVRGSMRILTQVPGRPVVSTLVKAGDLMVNRPLERHTWLTLADTTIVVMTRGPRGGKDYETDTYRLEGDERLSEIVKKRKGA